MKIICASVTDSIYNQYYLNLLIRKQDFTTIENLIKSGKINLNLEELQSKIKSLSESKKQYRISKVPINSANAEIGITKYKNGFIICSSRENNTTIERTHNWTKQPFLKLYYTENNQNTWSTPTLFANEIKCKYNKGPISFCNKEKEMWITENYVSSDNRSTENKYKLKICNYKLVDGKWIKQKDFPFNDRNFNVAHAAITEDGKTLYFSSDRPGGFGGMDLYYCTKTKKGWSTPINLGAEVNTWGNEVFPTLMEDGTIYFSSDGLIGIGGLDLFYTKNTNGIFLAPINIGAPINSEEDDFHLIFNSKTNKGYFSSNRINKGFDDDLFQFDRYESETKEESTREASTLEKSNNDLKDTSINVRHLIIINNENLEKMNGIKIFDSQNNPIEIESDNNDIQIDSSIKKIKIVKDGYYSKEIIFNEFKNQDTVKLKTNIGIAQADWYKIIYYDLDKSAIRPDAAAERPGAAGGGALRRLQRHELHDGFHRCRRHPARR